MSEVNEEPVTIEAILERRGITMPANSGVPADPLEEVMDLRYHVGQLHDIIIGQQILIDSFVRILKRQREEASDE